MINLNKILKLSLLGLALTVTGCKHQKIKTPVSYRPASTNDVVHDYGVVRGRGASAGEVRYCVQGPDSNLHYLGFTKERYLVGDLVPFTKN